MPRFAAFLRGVSPLNAKMPELKRCFEAAGFTEVRTVISSGNVVFQSRSGDVAVLERRIEAAMMKNLNRVFFTIVRPMDELFRILESDPFRDFHLTPEAKRMVTFFRDNPGSGIALPITKPGAAIVKIKGKVAYSFYEPTFDGPAFMALIEKTFGKEITSRTWETVQRVVRVGLD